MLVVILASLKHLVRRTLYDLLLLLIFLAISNVEIYEKGEGTPRDAY